MKQIVTLIFLLMTFVVVAQDSEVVKMISTTQTLYDWNKRQERWIENESFESNVLITLREGSITIVGGTYKTEFTVFETTDLSDIANISEDEVCYQLEVFSKDAPGVNHIIVKIAKDSYIRAFDESGDDMIEFTITNFR